MIVEHTDSLGSHRQIELQLRPVDHSSTGGHGTPANIALKLRDIQAVSSEGEDAIAALQP